MHEQIRLEMVTEETGSAERELDASAIANAEAREALETIVEEQAALRRVATLVARGIPSPEVFRVVSEEVACLFGEELAAVGRYDTDGSALTIVGLAANVEGLVVGTRVQLHPETPAGKVYATGSSARVDREDWSDAVSQMGHVAHQMAIVSTVACPVVVEGRLWGYLNVAARQPLPAETEKRLERFSDLVANAIANADSREAVRVLADEQAALRRVATLVARGVPATEIFGAVAEEVGRLLPVGSATMGRFESDGTVTSVASWSPTEAASFPTGVRWRTEGTNVAWMVLQTGRSARIDDFSAATDPIGVAVREAGVKSAVGSPIVVEGHLWGLVAAASTEWTLPPDTEARLASFTELVATAIANAESSAEIAASRRRIVAASDDARRKIERDLHDGTQQRLIALALEVHTAETYVPPDQLELRSALSHIGAGLTEVVEQLHEISRGIHPAILSSGGLGPALRTLARRSPIPVSLNNMTTSVRLAEPVEVAAYYAVSEALANAAKHSGASCIEVALEPRNDSVVLSISDDGVGGADACSGSGLVGLTDRLEALGGSFQVDSPSGGGTHIVAVLPRELDQPPDAS